ncbi:hypothetical protein [Dyadobacter crusticola]|uniref:hypothetical protein n=1 Tax=Dyadobacter crusticola TaxID=292407 RepID=UPI00068AA837|nr:hypothetical protein [Dyadobacter crusticola]
MENGQGQTSQLDYLDYGCQLISEIYGKPDIPEWTNSDYIRLSSILYKKTHVQISPNTLKRIFGKIKTDARYYPQKATRDALASYIGYRDWESFTQAKPIPARANPVPAAPVTAVPPPRKPETTQLAKKPVSRRYAIKILLGLIVLIMLIGAAEYYAEHYGTPAAAARLTCRNPIGGNPHSAIFSVVGAEQYENSSEPLFLEFGDGGKVTLSQADSVVTHYYERPGRYYAFLKLNKQVVDSTVVYLRSNGWTATANMMYDTTRVYPVEIPGLFTKGKNFVSATEVSRAGVDTNRTFFIDFINSQPTEIDGDNFNLVTSIQTSADRVGVRCSQVQLIVFGESSRHTVNMMKPGCLHWTKLQFSEINKDGKQNGLDFLGADFRTGGKLQLRVENKRAKLYVNDKLVYEAGYQRPLRRIYGLSISFSGVGSIHAVSLTDNKSGKAFAGNF